MSEEQDNQERDAVERLNAQNRQLVEARMLPANKEVPQDKINAVIDAFDGYIRRWSIPVAQVAREIDYSESVLSQWKGNIYKGDMSKVTRAINDWMERDRLRREVETPSDSVPTFVAATIRTITMQAFKRIMMAAIVAPAGSGKTKVARVMAEDMRGVMMTCINKMTEREFLTGLLLALGGKPAWMTTGALMREIIGTLKGTRRPVFIDEAHMLGKALTCVRAIHDQAGVPIIMLGTSDILQLINDRIDGRGQFSSRTIRCNLMDLVKNAEDPDGNSAGRDLFTLEEIRAFFAMRQMRLSDDGLKMCWALACLPNYGCLRLIDKLVGLAADVNPATLALGRNHLTEALQMLVGGEARYLKKLAERHEETARRVKVA